MINTFFLSCFYTNINVRADTRLYFFSNQKKKNTMSKKDDKQTVDILCKLLKRSYKKELAPLTCTDKVDVDNAEEYKKIVLVLHAAVERHLNFWEKQCDFVCQSIEMCVKTRSIKLVKSLCFALDGATQAIKNYAEWRRMDGCYRNSPSTVRCIGGHCHGCDSISKVFMIETMLYDMIGKKRRMSLWVELDFDRKEMEAMIGGDGGNVVYGTRGCILMNTKTPVRKWSFRMVLLQLESISQRINNIKGLGTNVPMRRALFKLIKQCDLRMYCILSEALNYPNLQKKSTQEGNGLMSGNFTGEIKCTPQNNCGMSTIAPLGTWTDRLMWTFSRSSTKILNVIMWIDNMISDRMMSVRNGTNSSDIFGDDYEERLTNFRRSALDNVDMFLNSGQLQNQVAESLYPTIVGVDASVRRIDISQNFGDENDTWSAAKSIAPANVTKWMDSFLLQKRADFFLHSEHVKYMRDIREFAIIHTFEISCSRDGLNAAGFASSFLMRPEEIQAHNSTLSEMISMGVPIICKTGADYIVALCGNKTSIECEDACEALLVWSICMDKICNWKVKKIGFSHVYMSIVDRWCDPLLSR